jgi:predicted phosphatase
MSSIIFVTVHTWAKHILRIQMFSLDTTYSLKNKISETYGTNVLSQIIYFNNQVLEDTKRIGDIDSFQDVTVILSMDNECSSAMRVFSPRGSNFPTAISSAILHIFDMDDTLTTNQKIEPEVVNMLVGLQKIGHIIAIASFNRTAVEILRMNNVDHLFQVIACGWKNGAKKTQHIKHVFRVLNWNGPKCYFFDDQQGNINDVYSEMNNSQFRCTPIFVSSVSFCVELVSRIFLGKDRE